MNKFLADYSTTTNGYNIKFHTPTDVEFTGTEFVAQVSDKNGNRIKGMMCRKLLTTMVKVNGVSDIDFSVRQESNTEDDIQDVTMRLSGKAVDLNALCGTDVL